MPAHKICQCSSTELEKAANNSPTLDERPIREQSFREDDWTWDSEHKSSEVVLYGPGNRTALFHPGWSNGTAGVRGTKPLNGYVSYWELEISHRIFGTSIAFGIGTAATSLHANAFKNLIGEDSKSWGMNHKGLKWHAGHQWSYTEHFRENVPTTVGVLFDGRTGVLRFYKDRKDLGVAFTGLQNISEPLFPIVASTVARSEITLGMRGTAHPSLQDHCITVLAKNLGCHADLSQIPLPDGLKSLLADRTSRWCSH